MKLSDFMDGLNILRPYYAEPNGHHIGAEHDQFYAYKTDRPLSEPDLAKMRALGWFQPEAGDDDPYSPDDGWSAFT